MSISMEKKAFEKHLIGLIEVYHDTYGSVDSTTLIHRIEALLFGAPHMEPLPPITGSISDCNGVHLWKIMPHTPEGHATCKKCGHHQSFYFRMRVDQDDE